MGNCLGGGSGGGGGRVAARRGAGGPAAAPPGAAAARGGKRKELPHGTVGKSASVSPGHLKVILDHPFPELEGRDLHEDYLLGRELGRGEFGVTCLATHKETEALRACKSISKKKLKSAVDVEDVRREVAIMHHLPPHPNIVALRGVYEDRAAVHLVEELCEGGELFERILERGHYSERAAAAVARTIVEVVQVCHRHGVMHRDLKPENFLFQDKSEDAPLRAIDFGLSIMFKEGEVLSEIVGSPYYMAPEVLRRQYGPEADVWSAGVILYILLCGVPPFWAETEQGVVQAVLKGKVDYQRDPWPKVTQGAKELVALMLQPDPHKRLKAHEVLSHPWLRDAHAVPDTPLGAAVLSRMRQFSNMNKLKKMALRVIADSLLAEEVAGLREMFKLMDTDNSGTITLEELRAGLRRIGSQLGEAEVLALMKAADVDGNGSIDYQEFVAATMHLHKADNDAHIRAAFNHFDKDGSGFIDIAELEDALGGGDVESKAALLDIISEVDTNNDGVISYEEFASMMRKGSEWRKSGGHLSRGSSLSKLLPEQAGQQAPSRAPDGKPKR